MDALDSNRWRALLEAYRDAQDAGPEFIVLQQAQSALAQARSDLDRHRSRGPTGHADRHTSVDAIEKVFARDIAELQRRVDEQEREVKRIDAKIKSCSARRNTLHQLVEGVRTWSRSQGVVLPGDDAGVVPAGFGATVHVAEPPAGTRSFVQQPARPSGSGAPPASRASRVGVVARMMERVWS
jgi:hypothetical protein